MIQWSVLLDPDSWDIMPPEGSRQKDAHVSRQGIDEKSGTLNLYDLIPEQGDSLMVVNCGSHFEIRYHHWELGALKLTDEEVEDLKAGRITFN